MNGIHKSIKMSRVHVRLLFVVAVAVDFLGKLKIGLMCVYVCVLNVPNLGCGK